MQLNKRKAGSVRLALAAASAGLIGISGVHAEDNPWLVDSSVLLYKENDGRVSAVEPVVALKKDMGDEHILSMKLTLDSLTGASPNGAAPSTSAQTFTGPSGGTSYTTPANTTPLDDSFHDTRGAFNINWEQPWGERNRVSVGGNVSSEFDFKSVALNAALARDYNNKNTTLSVGFNIELDSIDAVGGAPIPLSMLPVGGGEVEGEGIGEGVDDTKTVTDVLIGVTQVINRHWLTQLNLSFGSSSGYHNDPYKLLSVVDGVTGLPTAYAYESRPDSRSRTSFFWQNKFHLTEDVIDVSYRYFADDWGITSHTLDFKYRYEMGGDMYIEPHLRWYSQTEADFYRSFLVDGVDYDTGAEAPLIKEASSDPRLAKFTATTIGIKYGIALGPDSELNFRIEQYQQSGEDHPAEAVGQLQSQDLFPELKATSVAIGYSFKF